MPHIGRRFLTGLMNPKDWVATFVAVLALATSVWSGIATRGYNRLAARPNVHIAELFASSSPQLGLVLVNSGPGIGIVDSFNLALDGKPLTGNWSQQWNEITKETGTKEWTNQGGFAKGDPLHTGVVDILIIVDVTKFSQKNGAEWKQQAELIRLVVERLTITMRYHSMYDERFEMEKHGLDPPKYRRENWVGRYVDWTP